MKRCFYILAICISTLSLNAQNGKPPTNHPVVLTVKQLETLVKLSEADFRNEIDKLGFTKEEGTDYYQRSIGALTFKIKMTVISPTKRFLRFINTSREDLDAYNLLFLRDKYKDDGYRSLVLLGNELLAELKKGHFRLTLTKENDKTPSLYVLDLSYSK